MKYAVCAIRISLAISQNPDTKTAILKCHEDFGVKEMPSIFIKLLKGSLQAGVIPQTGKVFNFILIGHVVM